MLILVNNTGEVTEQFVEYGGSVKDVGEWDSKVSSGQTHYKSRKNAPVKHTNLWEESLLALKGAKFKKQHSDISTKKSLLLGCVICFKENCLLSKKYPESMSIDYSCNTNSDLLPLGQMTGIDGMGRTFISTVALLFRESQFLNNWWIHTAVPALISVPSANDKNALVPFFVGTSFTMADQDEEKIMLSEMRLL
jgi:hypothetical protein